MSKSDRQRLRRSPAYIARRAAVAAAVGWVAIILGSYYEAKQAARARFESVHPGEPGTDRFVLRGMELGMEASEVRPIFAEADSQRVGLVDKSDHRPRWQGMIDWYDFNYSACWSYVFGRHCELFYWEKYMVYYDVDGKLAKVEWLSNWPTKGEWGWSERIIKEEPE